MKRSDPRSGVILVTVLWSIALLSALAMAASVTFRGFAGVMAVERDRVQKQRTERLKQLDTEEADIKGRDFLSRELKARLATIEVEGLGGDGQRVQTFRPLRALTTRDSGDFSIALLDGWATVADLGEVF